MQKTKPYLMELVSRKTMAVDLSHAEGWNLTALPSDVTRWNLVLLLMALVVISDIETVNYMIRS